MLIGQFFSSACYEQVSREQIVYLQNRSPSKGEIRTVFDINLDPNLEKGQFTPTVDEMVSDAFALLMAGTDTTAFAVVVITWALLNNPQMMQRLKAELRAVMPGRQDTLDWAGLEKLPYLVSKRLSTQLFSFKSRLTKRSAPSSKKVSASPTASRDVFPASYLPQAPSSADRRYQPEYALPPTHLIHRYLLTLTSLQTVVSSSSYVYHQDASTFPSPETFQPERWLSDPTDREPRERMESKFMPFSRGSRACTGLNLAWAELYLILAHLFRRFDVSNSGTTEADMRWDDCFVPMTRGHLKVVLGESAE